MRIPRHISGHRVPHYHRSETLPALTGQLPPHPRDKSDRLSLIEACFQHLYTVKPVLSDHIKQDKFLAFQTGGRLLLNESSPGGIFCTICL